jgi:hypothetical protein
MPLSTSGCCGTIELLPILSLPALPLCSDEHRTRGSLSLREMRPLVIALLCVLCVVTVCVRCSSSSSDVSSGNGAEIMHVRRVQQCGCGAATAQQ